MKNKLRRILSLLLVVSLALMCTGCSGSGDTSSSDSETADTDEEEYVIGVAVYNQTDPEMRMYYNYYKDYIAESFPVTFIESNDLDTLEDEVEFVETVKEEGGKAIISFYNSDLEGVLEACAENEIYYVMGSASVEDEEFEAVKDNEWFLGVIGPDDEEEYGAGSTMAQQFIEEGATSYMIMSGGAGEQANFMHYVRVLGMLTTLQDELGLTYSESIDDLAAVTEVTQVDTGTDISIVICPGYVQMDEGKDNVVQCLEDGDYDALMAAMGISEALEYIEDEINDSATTTEMLVGVVDCFSEENYVAVENIDANGNSLLNFVYGKYASMVAPAFAAVFNAIKGDADVVKPDGEAFRIYQSYWEATTEQEYVELYGYTQSIYENAYSASDLMSVIRAYNEDASFEEFQSLTESCDIDSVRSRME